MADGIADREIKQLTMRRVIKQWCAGKGLTTDSRRGENALICCYLTHFYGINTPTKAGFILFCFFEFL